VKIDEDVNLVTTKLVGFLTHIKKLKKKNNKKIKNKIHFMMEDLLLVA